MLGACEPNSIFARLGITVWQPRIARLEISCVVLLFAVVTDAAVHKILSGMLSVLNLDAADIQVINMPELQNDFSALQQKLNYLHPKAILHLSKEQDPLQTDIKLVQTYSPEFLLQHAQYKSQAYKDLLNLRDYIHGTT
jgi:hypothetical protein